MVVVLLTLASCIGDPCLLTILTYIKDYNPKLLVIIIIIIIRKYDIVTSCMSIYVSGGRYDSFLSFGFI